MADPRTTKSYDEEIAVIRENIRQLMEQATGSSGAASEDRIADRIADQEARLATLLKQQANGG
jgi:hypothetical protein